MRQLFNWIAKIFLLATMVSFAHANEIQFKNVSLTPLEKSWALNADVQLELSPALEQLVKYLREDMDVTQLMNKREASSQQEWLL